MSNITFYAQRVAITPETARSIAHVVGNALKTHDRDMRAVAEMNKFRERACCLAVTGSE